MRDGRSGEAVWPSGAAFLLLHTVDGWQHVTNITPVAVPTGGGLTMAASSRELVVAALPFDRLLVSPLLRAPELGQELESCPAARWSQPQPAVRRTRPWRCQRCIAHGRRNRC